MLGTRTCIIIQNFSKKIKLLARTTEDPWDTSLTRGTFRNNKKHWFVCFFWGLKFNSRIFHSDGDVTIAGEGRQILTYTRHPSPLSSEDSLACHIYCDRQGSSVYNGYLRGACNANALYHCTTAVVKFVLNFD